jgi:hypothetical protein
MTSAAILDTLDFPRCKKEAVIYTRVKYPNRIFITQKAKKYGISESTFIDFIIDKLRAGEWCLKDSNDAGGKKRFI